MASKSQSSPYLWGARAGSRGKVTSYPALLFISLTRPGHTELYAETYRKRGRYALRSATCATDWFSAPTLRAQEAEILAASSSVSDPQASGSERCGHCQGKLLLPQPVEAGGSSAHSPTLQGQ
eukprot:153718-Hanusia_phi.AAC.1